MATICGSHSGLMQHEKVRQSLHHSIWLSSDLYTIDDSLPFILNILLANFVGLLGVAIVLSYVQFFHRSSARELSRLGSISRSPIYASFTETLDGSSTIRAFSSKLLAAFVVSFIAMMAVVGSGGHFPLSFGTPGLVGLALSYATPTVSLLGSFLTSFTEREKEMVSIERVMQYMDIPQEDLKGLQCLDLDWPYQGVIEFQSVTMRYAPSSPPALHCISFTIVGGTKVGIVGRTGAGKSSIWNVFYQLAPLSCGCILVDGLDIGNVAVWEFPARFAVVPQSPFLFEGSLRDNLNPFQKCTDTSIWNILENMSKRL